MEPMITGSPITSQTTSFLPNYLLGTQNNNSQLQTPASLRTPRSIMKQHRVTWSPDLNKTAYYDVSGSISPEQNQSYALKTMSRDRSISTPNTGPPIRGLLSTEEELLSQSTSTPSRRPIQESSIYSDYDDSKENNRLSDDCCVTVFGFGTDALPFILQQFSQCGTIVKHEAPNKCNWIHVKFQSRLQAAKALEKNGRIFNSCMQIGVLPCTDQDVLVRFNATLDGVPANISLSLAATDTSLLDGHVLTPNRLNLGSSKPNMRPLTMSAASKDTVCHATNEGLMTKAKHYFLGW